ncbi:MAG: diguanylate cyclase [Pseudomonadales bacterium]|nr:diguanylate cyclase [Pseudomonadales bacterium]
MATPLTSSNTIEFNSAKRVTRNRDVELEQDKYQQLKFKLSSILQSSLELEQVLGIFHDELQSVIELNGLSYFNESRKIRLNTGRKATHSCGYRLITQNDYLGELNFYRGKRFTEFDLELIEDVLGTLICPLRNALQYREAIIASLTDPLTGAGNRIALDSTLRREIELAKRHRSPLSLLLIDVDDFKNINDKLGHKTGDLVLKELVSVLNDINRQTDLSFRYGGEEFVVLLNETNLPGALVIAQRLREAIEENEVEIAGESLSVTVSIGATALKQSDSRDSFFRRADKALYKAKDSGKNQVSGI